MLGDINDYRNKFGAQKPFPIITTDIKEALDGLEHAFIEAWEEHQHPSGLVHTRFVSHFQRVKEWSNTIMIALKDASRTTVEAETEIARLKAENARLMLSGRTHLQQSEHFQKKWDEALKENARLEALLNAETK